MRYRTARRLSGSELAAVGFSQKHRGDFTGELLQEQPKCLRALRLPPFSCLS